MLRACGPAANTANQAANRTTPSAKWSRHTDHSRGRAPFRRALGDASQYKDYVLFMLFIKYVSDKYGDSDDMAPPVTIPPGSSFKNDKWLTTLAAAVQGELDRVSQTLTSRIRLLADRYAAPLPQIVDEVEQLAAKVAAHLQKIGAY
jgi:hypothetical protein